MMWKDLPEKFTTREREACRWLEESGIRGWLVDMVDKRVIVSAKRNHNDKLYFRSLVEFADYHGWEARLRPPFIGEQMIDEGHAKEYRR